MENYRASCPAEVEAFSKEVRWLCVRLLQDLEDQFKDDVKVQILGFLWSYSCFYFFGSSLASFVACKRGTGTRGILIWSLLSFCLKVLKGCIV